MHYVVIGYFALLTAFAGFHFSLLGLLILHIHFSVCYIIGYAA